MKDLVQLDAQQFCRAIFWACWIGSAALQGSHPVPEAADGAGARHLQVGLEGSQKVDVAVLLFFPLTFLEFPRPKYHRAVQSLLTGL